MSDSDEPGEIIQHKIHPESVGVGLGVETNAGSLSCTNSGHQTWIIVCICARKCLNPPSKHFQTHTPKACFSLSTITELARFLDHTGITSLQRASIFHSVQVSAVHNTKTTVWSRLQYAESYGLFVL